MTTVIPHPRRESLRCADVYGPQVLDHATMAHIARHDMYLHHLPDVAAWCDGLDGYRVGAGVAELAHRPIRPLADAVLREVSEALDRAPVAADYHPAYAWMAGAEYVLRALAPHLPATEPESLFEAFDEVCGFSVPVQFSPTPESARHPDWDSLPGIEAESEAAAFAAGNSHV